MRTNGMFNQPDRIRKLLAAASPGPWEAVEDSTGDGHEIRMGAAVESPGRYPTQQVIEYRHGLEPDFDGDQWVEAEANARLIVALRNNAAALLDAVDALETAHGLIRQVAEGHPDPQAFAAGYLALLDETSDEDIDAGLLDDPRSPAAKESDPGAPKEDT